MRIGPPLLALLTVAAACLFSSCSSANLVSNQPPSGTGGGGSGPGPAKTTPVINWSQPGPISNITPLGPDQLNAGANVSGTFAYTPAAGTVLTTGSHTLSLTFTPSDTSSYNTASANVTIQVVPFSQPVVSSNCSSPLNQGAADFVYLSTGRSPGNPQIFAFAPQPDGSLTAVTGSPFAAPGNHLGSGPNLAGAGPILFVDGSVNVYSFAVHSDGCISLENTAVVGQGDPSNPSVALMRAYVDSRKSNLYVSEYDGGEQASKYLSFTYSQSSGSLSPSGATGEAMLYGGSLAIDASSRYAVTSGCSYRGGEGIEEFALGDNGSLSNTTLAEAPFPAAQSGTYWCPYGAAADHSGHFVIAMAPCPPGGPCYDNGNWQLASYSIDAEGKMTPSGDWTTMPEIKNVPPQEGPNWYQFSADDRYLAVGGVTSINVYAWDSANATLTSIASIPDPEGSCTATPSYSSCTGNFYGNLTWDRYNHLYTTLGNKLLVYNVTDSGLTQAPASPYAIQDPVWVTVVSTSAQ